MKENYTFPVIVDTSDPEMIDLTFPTFPFGATCVEPDEDVIEAAQDYLSLMVADYEDKNLEVPERLEEGLELEDGQKLVYVNIWMPYYRSKIKEVYVKKTLTIPQWLDILAKQNNINFSACLVESLKEKLSLK